MTRQETLSIDLPDALDPPPENHALCAKLARKKNNVIKQVKSIRKNYDDEKSVVGKEDDIIRSALTTAGLSLGIAVGKILRVDAVDNGFNYILRITFTLTDIETGYSEQIPWLAMGADPGDKAVCKAYHSGITSFLLKTFWLATDELEEDRTFAPMEPDSVEIMTQLEGYFRRQVPEGARFDRGHFYEAVWEHFKAWPSVPAAAQRIKDVIDIRETLIWDGASHVGENQYPEKIHDGALP